ncbi:MAG: rhomboid family intramembrane serine protease [Desulfobacteraceae bacterium]|nr:rhomboid family intramembrane serine protease [Desulfobacteraceae bacterium]MBC2754165.1 rhomboid family intramembrane serine protease [Desulfobacteraceae bacterium]
MYILFESLTQKQADLCALVLSASGLSYRIKKNKNGWDVWVEETHYDRALESMELYFKENRNSRPGFSEKSVEIQKDTIISGIIISIILLLWYILVQNAGDVKEIINRFGASAVKILDGEYYRSVTALMLHKDEVHLAGNMIGLFIFGTAVCSVTGWGTGWLMILISGVAGNLLNAFMYESGHVSIGASTAVFGAIGILAGYQGFKVKRTSKRLKSAWVPVACGLALLGLLGAGGAEVDIMAHLFGFFFGILLGSLYVLFIKKTPGKILQWLFATGVSVIVFWAWSGG